MITDSDFLYYYQAVAKENTFDAILPRCRRFVALLSLPGGVASVGGILERPLQQPSFHLVAVVSMSDFAAAAAALSRGLFS